MKTLSDIKKIAVLGAGTMGPGIAQTFAMGGYEVTMWTRREETREKAKAALKSSLKTFADEGEIKAEDIDTIYNRISFAMTVPVSYTHLDVYKRQHVKSRTSSPTTHRKRPLTQLLPAALKMRLSL